MQSYFCLINLKFRNSNPLTVSKPKNEFIDTNRHFLAIITPDKSSFQAL
ncbi:hypothetical protein ALTERO38_50823 [Alteromonas sp. 38]|nr:hypothetical protein ALTER154_70003 [Alteromonas sp. 154]VXB49814.1 hypothetical protein ALTERO38_50823 [Alteromonas sp. 38]